MSFALGTQIEKGNTVLINNDYVYDEYEDFFTDNADLQQYKSRFTNKAYPANGLFIVLGTGEHRITHDTLYLVSTDEDDTAPVYIMDKIGLNKVEHFDTTTCANVIDQSVNVLSEQERQSIIESMQRVLPAAGWRYSMVGLNAIIDRWWEQKKDLIYMMKKSPAYNGNFQIVQTQEFERKLDKDKIKAFGKYWLNNFDMEAHLCTPSITSEGLPRHEALNKYERGAEVIGAVYDLSFCDSATTVFNGRTYDEWKQDNDKYREAMQLPKYVDKGIYPAFQEFVKWISNTCNENLTKEQASALNEIMKPVDAKFKAAEGQKTTRAVGKACKLFRLDELEHKEDVWHVDHYEKEMKKPYEREYAAYTDAISPKPEKRKVVISVHPVDYWTQSFGVSWTSCHTIDKLNLRKSKSDGYSGMHASGTTSYMLDASSMVYYHLKDNEENSNLQEVEKINRCMFYWGNDKLCQSRLYPQGSDGKSDLYTQIRNSFLSLWSPCAGIANWNTEFGGEICGNMFKKGEGARCYTDWTNVSGCNVSYPAEREMNKTSVKVGARPICISCGEEFDEDNTINCCHEVSKSNVNFHPTAETEAEASTGSRTRTVYCADCGNEINLAYNDSYVIIDGEYYCTDCTFYCEYHDEYEAGGSTYVENYGRVCEDAYDSIGVVEYNGDYYHPEDCFVDVDGEYIPEDYRDDYIEINGQLYPDDDDRIVCCDICGGWILASESHYDEETEQYLCGECYQDLLDERAEEEDWEESEDE